MARYKVQCVVKETSQRQPGYKVCPFCDGLDIDKPTSKAKFAAATNDEFLTYGSWICLDTNCGHVFMHPKHLPDNSNFTPTEMGTQFGEF